ncbi:hopene-associated glycosyltransferase HpnB [Rippkaea orientalis PCC 8801]|uniref:Hopene-associated glycosyltransferase HpnB n=1 Tax=Rippkaea orientalis (strain PCC 8801 / RF-1) TaxID=41431 RepID=B7K6B3_RIPO1|nr:glycosyltransferase [Rippkaea orientalis]ACK68166.1 hopene-associated glycosyltransferase HpnB [Rippkaea orientalis PCC 8801]
MENILLLTTILSLIIWVYLLLFRGGFWLSNQKIKPQALGITDYPSVYAVIPARNEADVLPISLKSLLNQDYLGQFTIILIDDQSSDGTGEVAQEIAKNCHQSNRLIVISGQTLPTGWSGKLWAMEQGLKYIKKHNCQPKYILFTDADIEHHPTNLQELVTKSQQENLALTSLMVWLRCQSIWEQFLIPAFVFFFEKLYPFAWVNNAKNKMAAAAGGCILIRRDILEEIGGLEIVRQALIDDCSLAAAVKSKLQQNPNNTQGIWLGLSEKTRSLRPYDSLETIWNMVARTAYTQLNYSPLLLSGTVLGLTLVYLIPILSLALGLLLGNSLIALFGGITWILMAIAYLPTLILYKASPLWSLTLPIIAFLYLLMTIDSALRHWQGKGGAWKGRVYANNE